MIQAFLTDHGNIVTWVGIISTICFVASLAIIPLIICRLEADHFLRVHTHNNRHPLAFVHLHLLRYLLAVILLMAGMLMLFLPGQGLLTIILGLSLLDFPGKQKAVTKLLQIDSIQKTLNWIRMKGGKNIFHYPESKR
jgi:Putative transmembrane protein (PGPGW)